MLLRAGCPAPAPPPGCNIVLGIYHAGVEWHWWAGPADCSGPLTDLRTGGSLLDQLHAVHVVRCDEAAWRFLGLSLAGYNVLISLALAVIAGFGLSTARLAHATGSRATVS
jgi:disulfide bond formation protein DsbB